MTLVAVIAVGAVMTVLVGQCQVCGVLFNSHNCQYICGWVITFVWSFTGSHISSRTGSGTAGSGTDTPGTETPGTDTPGASGSGTTGAAMHMAADATRRQAPNFMV